MWAYRRGLLSELYLQADGTVNLLKPSVGAQLSAVDWHYASSDNWIPVPRFSCLFALTLAFTEVLAHRSWGISRRWLERFQRVRSEVSQEVELLVAPRPATSLGACVRTHYITSLLREAYWLSNAYSSAAFYGFGSAEFASAHRHLI